MYHLTGEEEGNVGQPSSFQELICSSKICHLVVVGVTQGPPKVSWLVMCLKESYPNTSSSQGVVNGCSCKERLSQFHLVWMKWLAEFAAFSAN